MLVGDQTAPPRRPTGAVPAPHTARADCARQLACPACSRRMAYDGRSVICPVGHRFEFARAGYVDLSGGRARHGAGELIAQVDSHSLLPTAEHPAPLTEVLRTLAALSPDLATMVDLGTGSGRHLGAMVEARAESGASRGFALGFDLSKAALARAAQDHADCFFGLADVASRVPVPTASVGLVTSISAPCPRDEVKRILRAGGALIVADPSRRRLEELQAELAPELELEWAETLRFEEAMSDAGSIELARLVRA